jgi:hypothetical protein
MSVDDTQYAQNRLLLFRALTIPLLLATLLLAARGLMRMQKFWVLWQSGAQMSFPGQAQYHFWTACSGVLLVLAGATPLLMVGRIRLRELWPPAIVWLVLMAASRLASQQADRLYPY